MRWLGHLSSDYIGLLKSIRQLGEKVPCEWKPGFWYPEDIAQPEVRAEATKIALAGCRSCPVIEQCFEYALEHNERHGIWGGSLPHERI